jgi:4-hydroxy-tetrahydrodipicolinate synthase
MHYAASKAIHRMAPGLAIWECDAIAYRAGWAQEGIVIKAQIGTTGYLFETPGKKMYTEYWELIWDGKLAEAAQHAKDSGYEQLMTDKGPWWTSYPGRPEFFTHWGEPFRYAASLVGLPIGDYPHSRPRKGYCPNRPGRSSGGPTRTLG